MQNGVGHGVMERHRGWCGRAVEVLLGMAVLAGIAGLAGWPRPFNPTNGWVLTLFVGLGLSWLVEAFVGGSCGLSVARAIFLAVMLLLIFTGAPWFV